MFSGGKIEPRDVVDGHREKTLHVLWRIIFSFQIEVLLSEEQLRQEIYFLKQNYTYKANLEAILNEVDDNLGKAKTHLISYSYIVSKT